MDAVANTLFQFQDRPPLPEPAEQVDVAAGRRLYDGNAALIAYSVFLCELLDLRFVVGRCDTVRFLIQVLLTDEVPSDHEPEHEEAPQERNHYPDQLDPFDRLVPPNAIFGRCDSHA